MVMGVIWEGSEKDEEQKGRRMKTGEIEEENKGNEDEKEERRRRRR
jgi:hypothetical protein